MHKKESSVAKWLRTMANGMENRTERKRAIGFALLMQVCLYLIGFSALCKAAFTVSSPLGWAAIAVSCFVFEWLSRPDNEESANRNNA
jgi:hypothetical protein